MSYGVSAAIQVAVFQALSTDAALASLVGTAIYDQVPAGSLPDTYVTLGPETVRERGDVTGPGAVHDFTISVLSDAAGFQTAKDTAAAISDALVDADLVLSRGRLVYLRFLIAKARLETGGARRRIDLTFRAGVEDE